MSSGFFLVFCSLDEQFFFSSSRQKFDPFLCREEEFITLKEEDKEEDKEDKELKKRRAGVCSVSRSLSLFTAIFVGRECVFFFQRVVLLRDKNSSGFLSSLSSSSSWRLLQRRRRLRRHFSRKTGAEEEEEEALFLGKASKLALLRRRRRRRNNKSGKRGLGWLFGRRLKKVLFCAKEEKTHRQRY